MDLLQPAAIQMRKTLIRWGLGAIALLVLWAWASTACELAEAREARTEAELRADSLAAEGAAARAAANGWAVVLGTSDPQALADELVEKDSSLARLARDLEASRVRVTELVRIVQEARGQVRTVADTVVVREGAVDEFGGVIEGTPLAGTRWSAFVPTRNLHLDWVFRDECQVVRGETGEGRLWFSTRCKYAEVTVDTALVSIPEPEVVVRHSFWRSARDVLIGAAAGVVICAVGC